MFMFKYTLTKTILEYSDMLVYEGRLFAANDDSNTARVRGDDIPSKHARAMLEHAYALTRALS